MPLRVRARVELTCYFAGFETGTRGTLIEVAKGTFGPYYRVLFDGETVTDAVSPNRLRPLSLVEELADAMRQAQFEEQWRGEVEDEGPMQPGQAGEIPDQGHEGLSGLPPV